MLATETSLYVVIVVAAVLVSISYVVTAYVIASMSNAQRRREVADEAAHRERLADLASQQTNLLITTNETISTRTATDAAVIEGKLDVIHGLVNSGLTAAKQSELEAITRELASMRELVDLRRAAGLVSSDDHLPAAIEETEQRRRELEAEIKVRRAADETARLEAEAQVALKRATGG